MDFIQRSSPSDSASASPPYNPYEALTQEEYLWMSVEKVLRSVQLSEDSIQEASDFLLNLAVEGVSAEDLAD